MVDRLGPRQPQVRAKCRTSRWDDAEGAVFFHEAVGHGRCAECGGGMTIAIQENDSARGVHAMREFSHASIGDELRVISLRLRTFRARPQRIRIIRRRGEQIDGHFRHYDLHDAFAVAGA